MENSKSSKDRFFSKISHDLRGAFTSILGFSDILNDPNENLTTEEISEFANRIGKQSHETFELLTNFINWLKLENYNYGLTKEKVELYDTILDVKNQRQKSIEKQNITLDISIDETISVFMDYEILNSIITNTLVFLIKTCSENSTIQVKSIESNEKHALLEISANYHNGKSSFLQNIDLSDLNNELSFPIVFAIKFTELSGGIYKFIVDERNNLNISIHLPLN